MNTVFKVYIISLWILTIEASAQTRISSQKKTPYLNDKCKCLDPELLKGSWEATNSNGHKIEFAFYNKTFYLKNSYDSIAHQFTSYEFFPLDSLSYVSNEGVIIKWPPDNCRVNITTTDSIEVVYRLFEREEFLIKYKRIKPSE
ncbi:MAG: hypothetical protein ABI772_04330 [Bacteroidota bacterium]